MKFLKKTAALLFCVALALSVMSVAAFADDEAELFAGLAEPQPNTMFEVTLVKASDATDTTDTSLVAAQTDNILDRDYVEGYEIKKTEDVTFDIMLAYNGSQFNTNNKIDAFQFTYDPGTASPNATGNKGVTISGLRIKNQDVSLTHSSGYENVYASSSLGSETADISMPDSTATKIGTITFSFDNAKQAEALTPTIKTMLIQVRGNQHPQWIVKAPSNASTSAEYPLGDNTYITDGNPGTGYNFPTSGSGETDYTGYEDGTASTYPIYVNPYYNITVNHLHANPTTGIAELVTDANQINSGTAEAPVYEAVTTTVKYYFDTGNIPSDEQETANKLPNEERIPGYTFQGWMVTANNNDTNISATWDAYVGTSTDKDGDWNEETSYKARVTSVPTGATGLVAWDGTNEATTPATYVTISARDTLMGTNPTGKDNNNVAVPGVKFIPVNTASGATTTDITSGYVGPITLTPVYTRDVYTVTFKADTDEKINANPASQARFGDAVSTDTRSRTDYYTIEDLADANKTALDPLDIHYNTIAAPLTGDNANLKKPGYKFVGWVPSGDGFTASDSGYRWETDYSTRVNKTAVIRNGGENGTRQMKKYGDLTLTAEWELDIYFAKVNYWYAGTGNALILVAVPNANRQASYTYYCQSKNANNADENFAMFEIPTGNQRDEYLKAAITATTTANNADTNNGYTITKALFGFANADTSEAAGTYNSAYHLFAYIAPTNTTEALITLNETTSGTSGNTTFSYNGDVDGSNFVSVADFGNVDTLLNDFNSASGIFAITDRLGVEARLKADYTTDTDSADPQEDARAFASIADVKGIYGVMFTTTTP